MPEAILKHFNEYVIAGIILYLLVMIAWKIATGDTGDVTLRWP